MKKTFFIIILLACLFMFNACEATNVDEKNENIPKSYTLESILADSERTILKFKQDLPKYDINIKFGKLEDTATESIDATSEKTYFEDGHLEDIIIIIDEEYINSSYTELRYLVQHELIHIYSFGYSQIFNQDFSEGMTDLLNIYLLETEGLTDPSNLSSSSLYGSNISKIEMDKYLNEFGLEKESTFKKFLRFFWNKEFFKENFQNYFIQP